MTKQDHHEFELFCRAATIEQLVNIIDKETYAKRADYADLAIAVYRARRDKHHVWVRCGGTQAGAVECSRCGAWTLSQAQNPPLEGCPGHRTEYVR